MPRAAKAALLTELTLEERRERRRLRREKQRGDNVKRAAKMHAARLKMEAKPRAAPVELKKSVFVGCSGWRYWKWRDSFYAGVPQDRWFGRYLKRVRYRRNQRLVLFMADGCGRSGVAPPAREEEVRLHRKSL